MSSVSVVLAAVASELVALPLVTVSGGLANCPCSDFSQARQYIEIKGRDGRVEGSQPLIRCCKFGR